MRMNLTILFPLCLSTLLAQDTGTAHKAAATALLNSNNSGAARLACPATIGAVSTANSPGGPGRAGGPPGRGGAAKVAVVDRLRLLRRRTGTPKAARCLTTSTC